MIGFPFAIPTEMIDILLQRLSALCNLVERCGNAGDFTSRHQLLISSDNIIVDSKKKGQKKNSKQKTWLLARHKPEEAELSPLIPPSYQPTSPLSRHSPHSPHPVIAPQFNQSK